MSAVRVAGPADVDELVQLIESAYRGESSRAGWTTEADLLDGQRVDSAAVAEVLASSQSVLLVVTDDTGLLGCCQLTDRGDGVADFGMFAVRPTRQGAGIGRVLLTEASRYGQRVFGATAMEMKVIAQRTDLIGWYERLGFVRTGQTLPFPYGQPRFGLPRRDDLYFIVLRRSLLESEQSS